MAVRPHYGRRKPFTGRRVGGSLSKAKTGQSRQGKKKNTRTAEIL